MQTFNEYVENQLNYRSDMDQVSGTKPINMTIRDPGLRDKARWELINFFKDHNKVMEFMTNPEVRKVLIPMIEKEPHLRRVIDELSGGKYGHSNLTTKQGEYDSFPDKF